MTGAAAAAFFGGRPRPRFAPPAGAAAAFFPLAGLFFPAAAFLAGDLAGEAGAFFAAFFAGDDFVGEAAFFFEAATAFFAGRPRPRFAFSGSACSFRAADAVAAAFRPETARLGAAPFAAADFLGRPGFAGDAAAADSGAEVALSAMVTGSRVRQ